MSEAKVTRLFHKACAEHNLLADGDRVLIGLSGGKDSLMLVHLLARQSRIYKPRIEVAAAHVIMDNIPYETDRSYIEHFCHEEGIKLHILHSSFDESTDPRKTRCFLCSWNRRKTLFQFAEANNFNKVALGHHMDDILVTMLMNMTFEGSFDTMRPMMQMRHYPISIIRPMCLIHESMIKEIAINEGFEKQKTACPYEETTQRQRLTEVFHQLQQLNPEARYSMMNALKKINS